MKRRWFIRICFMLPILLCVGGWLWSSTHLTIVGYGHGDREAYLGTRAGTLQFAWLMGYASPGWESTNEPLNSPEFWPSKEAWGGASFLGFVYRHIDHPPHFIRIFAVPYWFLIVVCGGVFTWVCRKTGKPKAGRAFPVELAAKGDRE